MLETLRDEIASSFRSLRRQPGFTAVVTLTLALGIGANTAIFTVINGVLLRPLPYSDPDSLITVAVVREGTDRPPSSMSQPDFEDVESRAPSVASLVGFSASPMTLTGTGEPLLLRIARVSEGLLGVLEAPPILGRDIRAEEAVLGGPDVIVLSHRFWMQHFGGRADTLGQSLELDGVAFEVVGVAPPGFEFPGGVSGWRPRQLDPEGCARGCHTWNTIGRLAPGATLAAARAEVAAIADTLASEFPVTNTGKGFLVRTLQEQIVGDVRAGLWILLAAVGAVLLIACANVANLLVARSAIRRSEVSMRAALGASPGRLAAGVLIESAILSAFGGLAGLALASVGVEALRSLSAGIVPRVDAITFGGPVFLYVMGIAALVAVVFGVGPALRLAHANPVSGLSGAGRGQVDAGGRRLRTLLTTAEMALSVSLLIGAGLLLRTLTQLVAVDVGFETRQILRFSLSVPSARYAELADIRTFYRTLEARIGALPGVEAVGAGYGDAFGRGYTSGDVRVDGRPDPAPEDDTGSQMRPVGPGYFDVLRIPLIRGRLLTPADDASTTPVAVVNQTFVRENFPDEEVLGKRVRVTVGMGFGSPYWTIVGVVGDTRQRSLDRDPSAQMFVPHGQFGPRFMTINVRGVADTAELIDPIRGEVRALDADVPLQDVETLAEVLRREVAPTRFFLVGVGVFAVLALVLAAIGLYGVMAYLVSTRTREIGVRTALGASRSGILGMVVRDGMKPSLAGLMIGFGVALMAGRALEGLLYGVTSRDPVVLVSVPLMFLAVALAATLVPALRASRVDPVEALRAE